MTAARRKGIVLVSGLVVSALTLVSWTQPWFRVRLESDAAVGGAVTVGGEVAAGGLAALGLAGLALVGALSIAGPVFRIVLAALEVLIGVAVVLSTVVALADPVAASGTTLTESTGITGDDSLALLAGDVTATIWPGTALVLGVATMVLGLIIGSTSARWPTSGSRYSATRLMAEADADETGLSARLGDGRRGEAADAAATSSPIAAQEVDSVADWDALSDGSDPTTR